MKRSAWLRPFGEFAVIVVGVLTALVLESSWQEFQDAREEARYYDELRMEVDRNVTNLNGYRVTIEEDLVALRAVIQEIEAEGAVPDAGLALDALVRAATRSGMPPFISRDVFADLQGTGILRLISSDDVRRGLVRAYAVLDRTDSRVAFANEQSASQLLPLLTGHGVRVFGNNSASAEVLFSRVMRDSRLRVEMNREQARQEYLQYYLRQAEGAFTVLLESLGGVDR